MKENVFRIEHIPLIQYISAGGYIKKIPTSDIKLRSEIHYGRKIQALKEYEHIREHYIVTFEDGEEHKMHRDWIWVEVEIGLLKKYL
jgi:hypothetical protein